MTTARVSFCVPPSNQQITVTSNGSAFIILLKFQKSGELTFVFNQIQQVLFCAKHPKRVPIKRMRTQNAPWQWFANCLKWIWSNDAGNLRKDRKGIDQNRSPPKSTDKSYLVSRTEQNAKPRIKLTITEIGTRVSPRAGKCATTIMRAAIYNNLTMHKFAICSKLCRSAEYIQRRNAAKRFHFFVFGNDVARWR